MGRECRNDSGDTGLEPDSKLSPLRGVVRATREVEVDTEQEVVVVVEEVLNWGSEERFPCDGGDFRGHMDDIISRLFSWIYLQVQLLVKTHLLITGVRWWKGSHKFMKVQHLISLAKLTQFPNYSLF